MLLINQVMPLISRILLSIDRMANNAWMPQIEALFKTKKPTFVLVGILHLVGDDGLLNQLSAKGYQIERF